MTGLTDEDRAELHAAARGRGPRRDPVSARRALEGAVEAIVARHVAAAGRPARARRLCELTRDAPTAEDIAAARPRRVFDPDRWGDFRALEPGSRLPVYDSTGERVGDWVVGEAPEPADDEWRAYLIPPPGRDGGR